MSFQHPLSVSVESREVGKRTTQVIMSSAEVQIFSSLGIMLMGITRACTGYSWARTCPEVTQLLVTYAGCGEVLLKGRWHPLPPGKAYLTPAAKPHAYRAIPRQPWTIIWINYTGQPAAFTSRLPERPEVIDAPAKQLYFSAIAMQEALANGTPPALMDQWGTIIHQTVLSLLNVGRPSELTALWKAVANDLAHPWDLPTLARYASMGKERLRRHCLKEKGCSPVRYVARLRFQKAAEMIAQSNLSIQSIAESVGFPDPFTFSTAFKRTMGVSPSKMR